MSLPPTVTTRYLPSGDQSLASHGVCGHASLRVTPDPSAAANPIVLHVVGECDHISQPDRLGVEETEEEVDETAEPYEVEEGVESEPATVAVLPTFTPAPAPVPET